MHSPSISLSENDVSYYADVLPESELEDKKQGRKLHIALLYNKLNIAIIMSSSDYN